MRIRHFGLLANALRKASIPICKQLLDGKIDSSSPPEKTQETWQVLLLIPLTLVVLLVGGVAYAGPISGACCEGDTGSLSCVAKTVVMFTSESRLPR